jgi:small redox-active disulfide protein 2
MQIIILGEECPECDEMEARVRDALGNLGVTDATIEHVYDIREMIETFSVTKTPALVVDGTLVTEGEVPSVEAIMRMIEDEEYMA